MASYNYPYHITKDTPAVAAEVQTNFDGLLAWLMGNVIQKDGSVSMTAPLVLAPGAPASPDQAANKAYVDAMMPIGVIWEYAGTSLPTGWLWCNGNTYSDTSQPKLSAAIGRSFTDAAIPAGSFSVPDKRGRVGVGFDATVATEPLGKKGGTRDSQPLWKHTHTQAPHKHTVPIHNHGGPIGSSTEDAVHTHKGNFDGYWGNGPPNGLYAGGPAGSGVQGVNNVAGVTTLGQSAYHHHTVTVPDKAAFDVDEKTPIIDDAGTGTSLLDMNMPPYLVCNYIIHAGA